MLSETILPLIGRWVHILAAVTAVGGMLFMRFVLMPAAGEALTDEQHVALRERVMTRWRKVVGLSIALLLVTGVYNFIHTSLPKTREFPAYNAIFGVKFLLALGVFFLASALTGQAEALAPFRARARLWLTVSSILALAVVILAGILGRMG